MRRPSLGQNSDDLSRLSKASAQQQQSENSTPTSFKQINTASDSSSPDLPDIVQECDWEKPRKRKERQDSTSSITQDRKLVRSNSEEYLTTGYDVIRRVSSHEDCKKLLNTQDLNVDDGDDDDDDENENETITDENKSVESELLKNINNRIETSPARSRDYSSKYRISPNRDGKSRCDDFDSGENENRRNSERFSKARGPPGRKSASSRKPAKYLASKLRDRDENVYKYDTLKSERRGFISKEKNQQKKENNLLIETPDYNDNNLIDSNSPHDVVVVKSPKLKNQKETLPWDYSFEEDQPVVCQRFADHKFDHVNNSSDKIVKFRSLSSSSDLKTIGGFKEPENLMKSSRDTSSKRLGPACLFVTPDERIKQINRRLVVLKRKTAQFDEKFENENGFKPSQSDKGFDRAMKNYTTEIHKLRKEKQQLRSDPMASLGFVTAKGSEIAGEAKLTKMIDTISDIEERLQVKRDEVDRSFKLEDQSSDQLVQEKTAMQRALLYLESLYGRPITRDERDAARPLYNRYRIIKRMVSRDAALTNIASVVPELPTILEHEAMAFTAATSTDIISSPSVTSAVDYSPSDKSTSVQSSDSTDTSSSMTENVHIMSIDELWNQLDSTREEMKCLKRSIKDFEQVFEERNGRKMLKSDRKLIEETYALYKQKKAKVRLLDALVKKHMSN